ncbi:hypothetical protein GCM10007079_05810 [Nocardiopsis terrae]|nr:hypothetical protein GCM10007079_05810 [Nocardiopsis terrae]
MGTTFNRTKSAPMSPAVTSRATMGPRYTGVSPAASITVCLLGVPGGVGAPTRWPLGRGRLRGGPDRRNHWTRRRRNRAGPAFAPVNGAPRPSPEGRARDTVTRATTPEEALV